MDAIVARLTNCVRQVAEIDTANFSQSIAGENRLPFDGKHTISASQKLIT
jgi:hypothetical protein